MPNVTFFAPTDASHALWAIFYALVVGGIALAGYRIKTWPAVKGQINAARKIERDADADLRGDLFERIKLLEQTQVDDRNTFSKAMSDERRRCDDELDALRARMRTAEDELRASEEDRKGLRAMIRQAGESAAFAIGRPDEIATSKALKRARERKS